MSNTISPSTAASIASRVYDTRKNKSFKSDFHLDFIKNFKITNSQIQGVSGGLVPNSTPKCDTRQIKLLSVETQQLAA
ncbi:hypothetical protein ACED29_04065 [Shewanella sp. 5S214]|uniref:hypothetical protein n=1 Tax=Shewanella sp. 5S214 TaxID=3229999 RepID=UPI00352C2D41